MCCSMNDMEEATGAPSRTTTPGITSPRGTTPTNVTQHQNTNGGKITSRNANSTTVLTSIPNNEAELQLYRVMQRASLLAYYDTLLEMGGDDLQQLCDAGEEEFLEIMALVGMASKPLHVRRLQKALHEWVQNPEPFRRALTANELLLPSSSTTTSNNRSHFVTGNITPVTTPPIGQHALTPENLRGAADSPDSAGTKYQALSPGVTTHDMVSSATSSSSTTSNCQLSSGALLTSLVMTRLASAAETLARHLPPLEPRPPNNKKRVCRELERIMDMPEDDPLKMQLVRQYAAIYGRFDCKRRPERPLTLHEACVNEAAAQLCRRAPALLTRRDELFPLARKLVRDSNVGVGFGGMIVGGQAQGQQINTLTSLKRSESPLDQQQNHNEISLRSPSVKRSRSNSDVTLPASPGGQQTSVTSCRQNFNDDNDLTMTATDLTPLVFSQRTRSSDEGENKTGLFTNMRTTDSEDTDSRYSYSNSSSPHHNDNGTEQDYSAINKNHKDKSPENDKEYSTECSDGKVQVIATKGDSIIAVANPALLMSGALLTNTENSSKRQHISPITN